MEKIKNVVDDAVLASLYHLSHLPAPQDQCKTKCAQYQDLLISFCSYATKVRLVSVCVSDMSP